MKKEAIVKNYILDKEELEEAILSSKVQKKKSDYEYRVIMESGCDFAIQRKSKESNKEATLVILISQSQFYIEANGKKRILNKSLLVDFFKGLGRSGVLKLSNVNWLDKIKGTREYCNRLYGCIMDEQAFLKRIRMIKTGDFFLSSFHLRVPNTIGEKRWEWYEEWDEQLRPVIGGAYAPMQENLNETFLNVDTFADGGEMRQLKVYKGYSLDFSSVYQNHWSWDMDYEWLQSLNYDLHPTLYCWMLSYLAKRGNVTKKEVLSERIPNLTSTDSLIFQSFASFALISHIYGIDLAKRGIEMYYDSGIRDVLSLKQMAMILSKKIPQNVYDVITDGEFEDSVYNLSGPSFLTYLFTESKRQGYANQMNLFLYQWGQALFLQDFIEAPKMDKYPKHLASKTVELLSVAGSFSELMEKKAWKSAIDESKKYEYEGDKYKIITAKSHGDLVEEAKQQKNCVLTYEQKILNGESMICFLRSADPQKESKSILTIEVDLIEKGVRQVKARFNRQPKYEEWMFVSEWEAETGLRNMTFEMPMELWMQEFID